MTQTRPLIDVVLLLIHLLGAFTPASAQLGVRSLMPAHPFLAHSEVSAPQPLAVRSHQSTERGAPGTGQLRGARVSECPVFPGRGKACKDMGSTLGLLS